MKFLAIFLTLTSSVQAKDTVENRAECGASINGKDYREELLITKSYPRNLAVHYRTKKLYFLYDVVKETEVEHKSGELDLDTKEFREILNPCRDYLPGSINGAVDVDQERGFVFLACLDGLYHYDTSLRGYRFERMTNEDFIGALYYNQRLYFYSASSQSILYYPDGQTKEVVNTNDLDLAEFVTDNADNIVYK